MIEPERNISEEQNFREPKRAYRGLVAIYSRHNFFRCSKQQQKMFIDRYIDRTARTKIAATPSKPLISSGLPRDNLSTEPPTSRPTCFTHSFRISTGVGRITSNDRASQLVNQQAAAPASNPSYAGYARSRRRSQPGTQRDTEEVVVGVWDSYPFVRVSPSGTVEPP